SRIIDPHVRNRLLLRADAATGAQTRIAHAGQAVLAMFFRQFWNGGNRGGLEACPLCDPAVAIHCPSVILSWTYDGRALIDIFEAGPAKGIRPAGSGRHPYSVWKLRLPGRCRLSDNSEPQ